MLAIVGEKILFIHICYFSISSSEQESKRQR